MQSTQPVLQMFVPAVQPSTTSSGGTHISELSVEVLSEIFQNLSIADGARAGRVCRCFHVVQQASLQAPAERLIAANMNNLLLGAVGLDCALVQTAVQQKPEVLLSLATKKLHTLNQSLREELRHPNVRELVLDPKKLKGIIGFWQPHMLDGYYDLPLTDPRTAYCDFIASFEQSRDTIVREVASKVIVDFFHNTDFQYTQIFYIPEVLQEMSKECSLVLKPIATLRPEIGFLTNLRTLDVSENWLTELSEEIVNLKALEVLNVSLNCLTSLPSGIGNLQSLVVLNMDNNCFESLPPEIGGCSSLQELSVGNNQLSSLPVEINRLGRLRVLVLSYNKFTSIPSVVLQLRSLEELFVTKNPLAEEIPLEIKKIIQHENSIP